MGDLLNYAVKQMKKRNIPLSILWGETRRYRNYGWEMAGSNMIFTITGKSILGVNPEANLEMEGYRKKQHLDSIIEMREQNFFKIKRTTAECEFLFNRPELMIWIGCLGSEKAYLILLDNSVIEFGGSQKMLPQMLFQLFSDYTFSELRMYCPENDVSLIKQLYAASSIWQSEPLGMLKIIDLQQLLECFKPQLNKNLRDNPDLHGESVTLEMRDSRQIVTISVNGEIEIFPEEKALQKISLTDVEMVRMLFPFAHYSENSIERKFAPLLKLPFFWNQLDMV